MSQALYSVNQYPIQILLSWIEANEIAIPEIQRPFVWSKKQVRELIDSLYRGYPVGYLIAWKNHDTRLKNGEKSIGKKILIDGQQRITALMASILGKRVINKHYEKINIKISFNPIEEKFETFTPAIEKDIEWFDDISYLVDNNTNLFDVVNEYIAKNPNSNQQEIFIKLQKLKNILNNQIGLIELNSNLDIEEVTEIFIRINAKGSSLNQADFVMSKIAANESYNGFKLRKLIDYFCHLLASKEDYDRMCSADDDFKSEEDFRKISWLKNKEGNLYTPKHTDILRVAFASKFGRGRLRELVALLSGRNFETRTYEEEISKNSFKMLWDGVRNVINETNFKRFMMILSSAGLCHKSLIGSINVINYSYMVFLKLKVENLSSELIEKYVKKAYVFNILQERFSTNPEGIFDYDMKRIKEQGFINYFQDQERSLLSDTFWNVALPMKLNVSVSSSPFYRLYLAAQCFFNDKGFLSKSTNIQDMLLYRGDVHHIYPKNYLKKLGFSKNKYNQIANYALTEQSINIKISDTNPELYIKKVISQCERKKPVLGSIDDMESLRENFKSNCIPEYFLDAKIAEFDTFLKDRQDLMAKKIRLYYEGL